MSEKRKIRTKDKVLTIRIREADHRALKALAAAEGLSMAAYLARYVRREAKKQGIPT
jgi:predicted DNA binding CopG/RHH family protein